MAAPAFDERREFQRFEIHCPVTVMLRVRGRRYVLLNGQLRNIGIGGARISLEQPLPQGTPVIVDVHFRDPRQQVTTVRFKGKVEQPRIEAGSDVTIRFQQRGRFLRDRFRDLFLIEPVKRIQ